MVQVVLHQALGGNQHRGQAAFHIRRAAPQSMPVFVDQCVEQVVLPRLYRAGRHHVGVAGKAQYRAVMLAVVAQKLSTSSMRIGSSAKPASPRRCIISFWQSASIGVTEGRRIRSMATGFEGSAKDRHGPSW